jgi:hypothetical protein
MLRGILGPMATATSEAKTEPLPRETQSDTGPQRVYSLTRQPGMTYRKVADQLNISAATVARRVRDAKAERRARLMITVRVLMFVVLTACAVITTMAVATLAWG